MDDPMERNGRPTHYILNGRETVPVYDFMTWAEWMDAHGEERFLAKTGVCGRKVSTAFLGLDHAIKGPPALFETMIFGPNESPMGTWRYSTYRDAERGHFVICVKARMDAGGRPTREIEPPSNAVLKDACNR